MTWPGKTMLKRLQAELDRAYLELDAAARAGDIAKSLDLENQVHSLRMKIRYGCRFNFSFGEARVVTDALHGEFEVPEMMDRKEYLIQRILRGLNVKGLAEEHGADRVTLMKKLNDMSDARAAELLDAIARFWAFGVQGRAEKDVSVRQRLVLSGILKEDAGG